MISPLGDKILVRVDPPKDKTDTGILIHEEWKKLPNTGEVLAVGPKVDKIVVGDKVVFMRYGATILEKDLRLTQQTHILGKINES